MKTTRGIYIHIPFCLSKCTYCDFYSVALDTEIMKNYTDALVEEISVVGQKSNSIIDTIYIGGGTPSVLPLNFLEKIVLAIYKNFNLKLKEFTIEANPKTNIPFTDYRDLGIDRISLGVQTLNDKILKLIGRQHNSITALNTIDNAKKYFNKISCDLMLGLPTQTFSDVEFASRIISERVSHVSTYMLKLSENTKMHRQLKEGCFTLPSDDTFADLYDIAFQIFKENGLIRYEISNFALTGYESLHNKKYWDREEYFGFGASAHGFIDNFRYYNPSNLISYINGNNYAHGEVNGELIDKETALFEKIMLGFRLKDGIDIEAINREFDIDFESKYSKQLRYLESILEKNNNHIFVKEDKMLLESAVAREFLN